MGSSNPVITVAELRHQRLHYQTAKMSLWKVMTMSQVARQGAQAYEAHAAGRFVWGKEGFKWMSDDKSSSSQDQSSESLARGGGGGGEPSQLFGSQANTEPLQGYQPQPSW